MTNQIGENDVAGKIGHNCACYGLLFVMFNNVEGYITLSFLQLPFVCLNMTHTGLERARMCHIGGAGTILGRDK